MMNIFVSSVKCQLHLQKPYYGFIYIYIYIHSVLNVSYLYISNHISSAVHVEVAIHWSQGLSFLKIVSQFVI